MTTLKEKAIDYLSRREHSRLELKHKLLNKDFLETEIDETLNQLSTKNFQSDERFAECYVRARKQAGFGPLKIMAELKERGVSDAIISGVINVSDNEWREQMVSAWKKKFLNSTKDRAAQFRFLSSRGYVSETINKLLFSS